ncbi:lF-82 [Salmonella enterica]
MGSKNPKCTIIYRGEFIESVPDGSWLIIQRAKEYGGGFWLGKAYVDCFWLEFEKPMSLRDCMHYSVVHDGMVNNGQTFDDEFKLI